MRSNALAVVMRNEVANMPLMFDPSVAFHAATAVFLRFQVAVTS